MRHLGRQVLNHKAPEAYATLSITIKKGTNTAEETVCNINKGFDALQPREGCCPLNLSFNKVVATISQGIQRGVFVEHHNDSAFPKLTSEQASENSRGPRVPCDPGTAKNIQDILAKHDNRVKCPHCGDTVAVRPGAHLSSHGHGILTRDCKGGKRGNLAPKCVKFLAKVEL